VGCPVNSVLGFPNGTGKAYIMGGIAYGVEVIKALQFKTTQILEIKRALRRHLTI